MDLKEYKKEYYQKNKEQILLQKKEHYLKNREKILLQKKEHNKTPQRKKSRRISEWKRSGIIFFDYDLLYEIFINTEYCDLCNVKLTTGLKPTKTTRCLDHDHSINDCENVRDILCHSCNVKRG